MHTISSNGQYIGGLTPFALDTIGAVEAPKTVLTPVETQLLQIYPFERWGLNNDAPREYDKLIKENTAIGGAIKRQTDKLHAGGVEYGLFDEQGNFQNTYDQEEQDFMELSSTKKFIRNALDNYVKYNNVFTEVVFNEPKTKILKFRAIKAGEIRLQLQNTLTGKIDFAYQSANWNRHVGVDEIIVRPVIDMDFDEIDDIRANTKEFRYVLRHFIPGDKKYYQDPLWYSAFLQKWYDQSMFIPEAITAFIKRLIFVQFQIIFREEYMIKLYGDRWIEGDDTARVTMLQERTDEIANNIQSPANAGKFTSNISFKDGNNGDIIKGYEIIAFETKTISVDFLDFMREADQHLIWAVGEDPIGMGQHGNGSDNAGSGKKAAFNGDMSTNKYVEDMLLEPFYLRKKYNKLNPRRAYRIKLPFLADMNQLAMDKRNNEYPDAKKPADNANNN